MVGRSKTSIPINGMLLRALLFARNINLSQLAKSLCVTRQAVNGWINQDFISPRKLSDIVKIYNFSTEEINCLTDKTIVVLRDEIKELRRKMAQARDTLI